MQGERGNLFCGTEKTEEEKMFNVYYVSFQHHLATFNEFNHTHNEIDNTITY